VRLLTAGKSLVGIQDSKSRYRSVDPRAMPKFGSEKKFTTEVARESDATPGVARASIDSSKVNAEKTPEAVTRAARGGGWVSQWGSKLGSLVSQTPKPTRSAVPRFNGMPVQGELSLDNIRVVRNDLSDADLEVVAKKAETREQEEVEPPVKERKGKGERMAGWERVTTMFSAVES
jgi:hypothetical protein